MTASEAAADSIRRHSSGQESNLPALDLLASAVLLLDAAGAVRHANAAAESLFGLSRRQLMGQAAPALFDDGPTLATSLREGRDNRFAEKGLPLVVARPGAEPRHVSAVLVVLHGQPWAFVLEVREIEHRRRIELATEQWERADAQREILRNLAHEVKNPLGGLRGAAQLLQDELANAQLREYTQVIIAEADRLHALVDRILAPHRMPRVLSQVNIHEVCERVAALVQAEYGAGLVLTRDYDISVPELQADREQLIQIVLNIVGNAAQALGERRRRGDAEIVLRTRVMRQVTLARRRHALAVALSIADNGPGIPDSIRDRIFHPLVSGKEGGTGLGLSLVQTCVQQHGGVVTVESAPGHTVFELLLPLRHIQASGSEL
ncbi:MAG: nitrogen regulation protein NR(II) [Pigmentiphaga sp.]